MWKGNVSFIDICMYCSIVTRTVTSNMFAILTVRNWLLFFHFARESEALQRKEWYLP